MSPLNEAPPQTDCRLQKSTGVVGALFEADTNSRQSQCGIAAGSHHVVLSAGTSANWISTASGHPCHSDCGSLPR